MHEIQAMNDDLSKLFNDLPEGILVFNQTQNKASLVNAEFKRLFNIVPFEEEPLEEQIKKKTLKEYNIKLQDSTIDENNRE